MHSTMISFLVSFVVLTEANIQTIHYAPTLESYFFSKIITFIPYFNRFVKNTTGCPITIFYDFNPDFHRAVLFYFLSLSGIIYKFVDLFIVFILCSYKGS